MLAIQLAYWGLVSFPLVVGGTILGRVWSGQKKAPCRVNNLPRPIPPRRWVSHPVVIAAVSGILPFGSIFIEMYFVFTSFWNYKFYYVYGFMLLVYVILIIVSSCVTVVAMYFLLNAEGECLGVLALARMLNLAHWCRVCGWLQTTGGPGCRSSARVPPPSTSSCTRFTTSSTRPRTPRACAVLLPRCAAVSPLLRWVRMNGLLQTAFYFGYMGMFCTGLMLLCGTIGVAAASRFVHRIYRNIKVD